MKILRLLAKVVAGVLVLFALTLGAVYFLSSQRMSVRCDVDPASIVTSDDSTTLALGAHIADIRGCTDCHGPDLRGRTSAAGPSWTIRFSEP
jgi:mono/diheme cytochrome c family protein